MALETTKPALTDTPPLRPLLRILPNSFTSWGPSIEAWSCGVHAHSEDHRHYLWLGSHMWAFEERWLGFCPFFKDRCVSVSLVCLGKVWSWCHGAKATFARRSRVARSEGHYKLQVWSQRPGFSFWLCHVHVSEPHASTDYGYQRDRDVCFILVISIKRSSSCDLGRKWSRVPCKSFLMLGEALVSASFGFLPCLFSF